MRDISLTSNGRHRVGRNPCILFTIAFAILSTLLAVVGCTSEARDATVNLGQESSIAVGETITIAGEDLKIKLVDVTADSRCPTSATCVWQGEVTCIVETTSHQSVNRMTLNQPGLTKQALQIEFNDYVVNYDVVPYPEVGKSIKKSDYRLHLRIDKKFVLSGGILVTFDVVGERYSIFITNRTTIDQVFAAERGESKATIPSGRLIKGSVFYNEPWSWHIDSKDIQMAEVTIELCDGIPSQVEDNLNYWIQTVQRFCPWSAKIVKIEDFR